MKDVEDLFRKRLPRFVDCMTRDFGISLPITLVGGVAGVRGRPIAWENLPKTGYSKMIKDTVQHERNINSVSQEALNQFLLELFEKIFDASGKPRPPNFYGFPGAAS